MSETLRIVLIIIYVLLGTPPNIARAEVSESVLDSLKKVIKDLDRSLASGRQQELNVLSHLDLTEQKFNAQNQLVRAQRALIRGLSDSTNSIEQEIQIREAVLADIALDVLRLEDARDRMAASAAHTMLAENRIASWSALEFLFGADSWKTLMERRSLLSRLQTTQKSALLSVSGAADSLQIAEQSLMNERRALSDRRAQLARNKQSAEQHHRELEGNALQLSESKLDLKEQLESMQSSRELLEARRSEVAAAQQAIEELISRMKRGEPLAGAPLNLLKGLLPWPAAGRVVSRFGLQKNRKLDTVTENPGIDLSTSPDATVSSVAAGRISSVTWLRGFGNVCIIEHPGDFYTVYAKLGDVFRRAGEDVEAGQTLGHPGFDPANEDYRVHFEIWSGKTKMDPLQWLARK